MVGSRNKDTSLQRNSSKDRKRIIWDIYNTLLKNLGPQNWWPYDEEYHKKQNTDYRWEIIIGAILTQNTAWKNVEKAIDNMKKYNLFSFDKLLNIDEDFLANIIRSVGFYRIKAKRIKNFVKFVKEMYNGDLDAMKLKDLKSLRKELISIKGIGEETADAILLYAFDKCTFVVDKYTRRMFSRIGIIKGTESYDEIKNIFENSLPKDVKVYKEYHALIDEFSKNICKKVPLCENCFLRGLCKYYNRARGLVV